MSGSSDAQILSEIFTKHMGPVLEQLVRQTGSRDTANEIIQQALEAICKQRNLARIRDRRKYLFRVALRFGTERRRRAIADARMLDFDSVKAHDAIQALSDDGRMCPQSHAFLDQVGACAEQLSSNQQSVLRLVIEGYGQKEIAKKLDTTVAAVAQRLGRARKRIAMMLSPAKQGKVQQ